MGVPSFVRWLTSRYPDIMIPIGKRTKKKPEEKLAIAHLYVDTNGVVHPMCHPEAGPQPANEEEMLENVCRYLDRLVEVLEPSASVYLALDGVAPRAKMNQQRKRRFCASREADEKALVLKAFNERRGVLTEKERGWDSNAITPGTPFAEKLGFTLRAWATTQRKGLCVLVDDAAVPGEGEHKIIKQIRATHTEGRHAIVGQDADLVLLGLSLHLPKVVVVREDPPKGATHVFLQGPTHLLSLQRLRRSLETDPQFSLFRKDHFLFPRFIDDLILLCTLVGNDFLPQVPSLCIPEGGLDLLLSVYAAKGALLHSSEKDHTLIDFCAFADILDLIASVEPEILRRSANRQNDTSSSSSKMSEQDLKLLQAGVAALALKEDDDESDKKDLLICEKDRDMSTLAETALTRHYAATVANATDDKLGSRGFRERYYAKALKKGSDISANEATIKIMCQSYLQGLTFVEAYYHRGDPDLDWYYGYHYAPLAADLANVCRSYKLTLATTPKKPPVSPIVQLMAVLPPSSAANLLPRAAAKLMTSKNDDSPLASLFPETFDLDPNGKPVFLRWLWVPLLPFADIDAIQKAFAETVEPTLSVTERRRNQPGFVELFGNKDVFPGTLKKREHHVIEYIRPIATAKNAKNTEGKKNLVDDPSDHLASPRISTKTPRLPLTRQSFENLIANVHQPATNNGNHHRRPPPRGAGGPVNGAAVNGATPGGGAPYVPQHQQRVVACRYWARGHCARGANCTFLHAAAAPPPVDPYAYGRQPYYYNPAAPPAYPIIYSAMPQYPYCGMVPPPAAYHPHPPPPPHQRQQLPHVFALAPAAAAPPGTESTNWRHHHHPAKKHNKNPLPPPPPR